jgi:hypothetical protein
MFDLKFCEPEQAQGFFHGSLTDMARLDIGTIKATEGRHIHPKSSQKEYPWDQPW